MPEERDGDVPATEGCSDRCENTVRGTLTLTGARSKQSACWEAEILGPRQKIKSHSRLEACFLKREEKAT